MLGYMIHPIYPTTDIESAPNMSHTHLTQTELIFIKEYIQSVIKTAKSPRSKTVTVNLFTDFSPK